MLRFLLFLSFTLFLAEASASEISLPSGPGSIQGLGSAFEPSLNTGDASYSVSIDAPAGRAGHGAAVSLSYSSGQGYGLSGLGWALNLPSVERRLEQGQPSYSNDDSFQFQGQRLIALTNGRYAPQIQGKASFPVKSGGEGPLNLIFERYQEGWKATDTNGYQYYFATARSQNYRPDLKDGSYHVTGEISTGRSGPDPRAFDSTFCWYLSRVVDPLGHEVEFFYQGFNDSDGKLYPAFIRYNVNDNNESNRIAFEYETRSDKRDDYQAGFFRHTSRRIAAITTHHGARSVYRYVLRYQPQSEHSTLSLLQSITKWNRDETRQLPPVSFTYSELPAPELQTLSETRQLPSGINLKAGDGQWFDLNADGLSDWVYYLQGRYWWARNKGLSNDTVSGNKAVTEFSEPEKVIGLPSAPPGDPRVHFADLDGDGASDMLHRTGERDWVFYRNQRDGSFAPGALYPVAPVLVPGTGNVRFTDINFDQRIDLVSSDQGRWHYCLNGASSENTDTADLGAQNPYDQDMPPYGNFPGSEDIDHNGNGRIDLPRWRCGSRVAAGVPSTFELGSPGVSLQDVNGDRLDDLVRIRFLNETIEVGYFPQTGLMQFGKRKVIRLSSKTNAPSAVGVNPGDLQLRDINGDGLADLMHIRSGQVIYWLQQGNSQWSEPVTLRGPEYDIQAVVKNSADLNGNGTSDLIWLYTDGRRDANWLDISAPLHITEEEFLRSTSSRASRSNLLVGIDNGMGNRTLLSYESTAEHASKAAANDQAWVHNTPLVQHMVVARRVLLTVDATGEGIPDDVVQYYRFRDPYYDPYRKQFRGFAFARVETQANPELSSGDPDITRPVSRHYFYTGAPDGEDNDGDGRTDERDLDGSTEELPLLGMMRRQEQTAASVSLLDTEDALPQQLYSADEQTWIVLRQNAVDTPTASLNGLEVSLPLMKQTRHLRYERQTAGQERVIDYEYNQWGKGTLTTDYGLTDTQGDESSTEIRYATHPDGLFQKQAYSVTRDSGGQTLAAMRYFFDHGTGGEYGSETLTKGLITSEEAWEKDQTWLPQGTTAFDDNGNPHTIKDGDGRTRTVEWDSQWQTFAVAENTYTNGPGGVLTVRADYDTALGVLTRHFGMNGGISTLEYDDFARLLTLQRPDNSEPATRYSYEQVDGFTGISYLNGVRTSNNQYVTSRITRTLVRIDGTEETQWSLFDGAGRTLANVEDAEDQGYVFSGVKRYDHQGRVVADYRPYFTDQNREFRFPDITQNKGSTLRFLDALGRPRQETLPAGEDGQTGMVSYEYMPYRFRQTDADGFIHEQVTDYAERVIRVGKPSGDQQPASPVFDYDNFTYDILGRLLTRSDPAGNRKTVQYDGLGRKIRQDDLDQGTSLYKYDNAGNILRKTDHLGRSLGYRYDGSARLLTVSDVTETDSSDVTYPDTSGVPGGKVLYRYLYDVPSPDAPESYQLQKSQLRGKQTAQEFLAHVNDKTDTDFSAEYYHYDLHGNLSRKAVYQQQRFYDFNYAYDAQERLKTMRWPDGDGVVYHYNRRGLKNRINGVIRNVQYDSDRQITHIDYAHGSQQTRRYDQRGRLTSLNSEITEQNTSLLDLRYQYNQRGFINNIINRVSSEHSKQFGYDAKGQLLNADSHYGQLSYGYDAIGNMTSKQQLGAIVYGHKQRRLQKEHGGNPNAPGPYAPVSSEAGHQWTYNGVGQRTETINPDGSRDSYLWDVLGRMSEWRRENKDGAVTQREQYTYGPDSRRLTKRSCTLETRQTEQKTLSEFRCKQVFYIDSAYEIRDQHYSEGIQKHIKLGPLRVARFDIPQAQAQNQLSKHTLTLNPGWNAVYLPVTPAGRSVEDQLGVLAPSIKNVIGFDASSQTYQHFDKNSSVSSSLQSFNGQQAYWIHSDAPGFTDWPVENVTQSGPERLQAGWNWTTFPLQKAVSTDEFLQSHPSVISIWAYDLNKGAWTFWHNTLKNASTLETLYPNTLYWVRSAQELPLADPAADIQGRFVSLHNDHLGSVTLTLDDQAQVLQHSHYLPYGGAANLQPDEIQPYGFSGKELDDSGLLYFEARYYDPLAGRFISPDPLYAEDMSRCIGSTIECNLYQYTGNNPLNYIDPQGARANPVQAWFFLAAKDPVRAYKIANTAAINSMRALGIISPQTQYQESDSDGSTSDIPDVSVDDSDIPDISDDLPVTDGGGPEDPDEDPDDKDITKGTNKGGLKGEPNSIHVQTSGDGKKAVQSTIYDCKGNACGHVDWKDHSHGSGKAPSGHGHRINPPGTKEGIKNAHGPGAEHILPENVPAAWKRLPGGLVPAQ